MPTKACSNGSSTMNLLDPALETPRRLGYRWPAEWETHRATWLVWPHNPATWPGRFEAAQLQFANFIRTVAKYEPVELLVTELNQPHAAELIRDLHQVHFHAIATNDSWIRDHGPVFLSSAEGLPPALVNSHYNAWGNKYPPFDLDNQVPRRIAETTGRRVFDLPIVLEGGSVEGNGDGLLLTTKSCLLNPNRNPSISLEMLEEYLREFLVINDIVWLDGDIPGDDTDGHIDQLARFAPSNTVLVVDRPNTSMFRDNAAALDEFVTRSGIELNVRRLRIPAPRQFEGMWLPASYANFYIVNGAVLVPVFGDPLDDEACRLIGECFPGRKIEPVAADDLIFGLGALHCLSQQEPLPTCRGPKSSG